MKRKTRIKWENVKIAVIMILVAIMTFGGLAYVNTHSLRLGRVESVYGDMVTFEVNGELYVIQDDNTGLEKGDRVRILFKDNGDGAGDDEIVNFMRAW